MSDTAAQILLIYPQTGASTVRPPHAYLVIGAVLKEQGFQVKLLDQRGEPDFFEELASYLSGGRLLFVGISSMTGTQIACGLSICRHIRSKYPRIPIVWGGVHPTLLPRQTIESEYVDIVVKNEGEQTCLELALAFRDGHPLDNISGILYRKNGVIVENVDRPFIDLDSFPPPDWGLIDVPKYIAVDSEGRRTLGLYTSRGCPFACTFCYNARFNQGRWRSRSCQSVLEEILWLVSRYHLEQIQFIDDNFMADRDRVIDICSGLIAHNLGITLIASSRPEYVYNDRGLIEKLAKAGFRKIYMGAESGSERMLELVNRSGTKSQCLEAARLCAEYGIIPEFSFMIGLPGETESDVFESLRFAQQLKTVNPAVIITDFKIFTPYPGTPLYDLAVRQGLTPPQSLAGWSAYIWGNVEYPWIEDIQFVRTVSLVSLFANYYHEFRQDLRGPVRRIGSALLHRLALIRWKAAFFDFPVEWMILRRIFLKGG